MGRPCPRISVQDGVSTPSLRSLHWGVDIIPGMEQVTLVGVDLDGMVHIFHLLLFFRVYLYLTSRFLFACWLELPTEGLPVVVEIPHESFAVQRSVCAMPQVYHVTYLGGIYLSGWQTMPCNRAGKTAVSEYLYLTCWGLSPRTARPSC